MRKPVSHYAGQDGLECIDAIRSALGEEGYRAYCRGNAIKYLWRYDRKGTPEEDLCKATVYLSWLFDSVRSDRSDAD